LGGITQHNPSEIPLPARHTWAQLFFLFLWYIWGVEKNKRKLKVFSIARLPSSSDWSGRELDSDMDLSGGGEEEMTTEERGGGRGWRWYKAAALAGRRINEDGGDRAQ
jgi:hypothetical protein